MLLFSFQIEFWLSEHLADGLSWCITNLRNSSCEHQVVIGGRNEPSLYLLDPISSEAAFFEIHLFGVRCAWPCMSPLTWILFIFSHPWNKCIVMMLLFCSCRSNSAAQAFLSHTNHPHKNNPHGVPQNGGKMAAENAAGSALMGLGVMVIQLG